MQDQPLACFQVRFWSCDVQMILSRPGAALRGLDGCSVYILPLGSSCAVRLVFPRTSWLLFGFCDSLAALWLELRLLARPNCPFREPLRDVCREKTCRSDAACGCPRQGGLPSSQDRSHAWTRVQRHERPRCRLVCNVCSGSSYSHQIQQKNEEEERGHLHGVLVQLLHQMPLEKKVGVVSPRTRTIPCGFVRRKTRSMASGTTSMEGDRMAWTPLRRLWPDKGCDTFPPLRKWRNSSISTCLRGWIGRMRRI